MFEFKYPFLIFAIFIPILLKFFSLKIAKKPAISGQINNIYFPNIDNINKAKQLKNKYYISWQKILFYLIWIAMIIALMQPQIIDNKIQINNKGRNMMLVTDLSASMNALDFSTQKEYITRLDVLKETTQTFLQKRKGDKIGLIIFADEAHLYTPLTFDIESLNKMLQKSAIGLAGQATAIGDAISLAIKNIKDLKGEKVIILLTDGENSAGEIDPMIAAKIAADYNIKIHVIAIGKNGIAPILTNNGHIARAQVKIDEKLLKNIAQITDGQYFHILQKNMFNKIYEEINKIEKIENEIKEFKSNKPLFQIPLAFALFNLIILTYIIVFPNYRKI